MMINELPYTSSSFMIITGAA